jgi:hypothetical protein
MRGSSDNDPFLVLLPVAIKGFFASIAFGVPGLVWVLVDRQGSQHKSSSKGAT